MILIFIVSSGIYYFEDEAQPESFKSIPHSFWWTIVTLTTVGYGDVYPVTAAGRVVGGITMLVGISAFAVVTARVASLLVQDRSGGTSGIVGNQVRDLAALRDEGLLSEDEFETKRREILGLD